MGKAKKQQMKFKILSLSANDKAKDWVMKIQNTEELPEAKRSYSINIKVDDQYFKDKIQKKNDEAKRIEEKPDMFADYKNKLIEIAGEIQEIKEEKAEASEFEIKDFAAIVKKADFESDVLFLEIPEKVITDIINLRHNVDCYVVNLK